MGSFNELGRIFTRMAIELPRAQHESLEKATEIVQETAKTAIGTYQFKWPPLAPSTQADRTRQGYAADEPLLRRGDFKDSIERTVKGEEGFVGTNDPRGRWFEFGTKKMPPRPVLMPALMSKTREIEELVHRKVTAILKFR